MAHLVVDYYADALGMESRMHALLPEGAGARSGRSTCCTA